jgi:uncharacterized protein (DUF2141 family)
MYRKLADSAAMGRLPENLLVSLLLFVCAGCHSKATHPQTTEMVSAESPQLAPILDVTLAVARSEKGVYSCGLFANEDDFNKRQNPLVSAQVAIAPEPAKWTIDSLPPGSYAIAVFHDENENGKLDRNAFGYPTEVYGFSNNARGKLGPPAYDDVRFELGDEPMKLEIRLK